MYSQLCDQYEAISDNLRRSLVRCDSVKQFVWKSNRKALTLINFATRKQQRTATRQWQRATCNCLCTLLPQTYGCLWFLVVLIVVVQLLMVLLAAAAVVVGGVVVFVVLLATATATLVVLVVIAELVLALALVLVVNGLLLMVMTCFVVGVVVVVVVVKDKPTVNEIKA